MYFRSRFCVERNCSNPETAVTPPNHQQFLASGPKEMARRKVALCQSVTSDYLVRTIAPLQSSRLRQPFRPFVGVNVVATSASALFAKTRSRSSCLLLPSAPCDISDLSSLFVYAETPSPDAIMTGE